METKDFQDSTNIMTDFFAQTAEKDFYDRLNLPRDATRVQIREAYLRIKSSILNNPAAFYSLDDESTPDTMLQETEEAYSVLENDHSRRRYDLKMGYIENSQGSLSSFNEDPFSQNVAAETTPRSFVDKKGASKRPVTHQVNEEILTQITELSEQGCSGEVIQQIRNLHALSLEAVHEILRIPLNLLTAIEEEDFESLPSRVYTRGFVRNYLKYLSIEDPDTFLSPYMERFDECQTK